MATIEIPDPEFSFLDVINRQTRAFTKLYLSLGTIYNISKGIKGNIQSIYNKIDEQYYLIKNDKDKLLFISGLIIHLNKLKKEYNGSTRDVNINTNTSFYEKDEVFENMIDDLLYYIYNLSSSNSFSFDKDTFTNSEIDSLFVKIDAITEVLETLKTGNEILYDLIDEVKSDFESLKSDLPLGKKRWYQRAAGIIISYVSQKGADEILTNIKPHLSQLIKASPEIFNRLIK